MASRGYRHAGNGPTERQLSYLSDLISKAGLTRDEFYQAAGLYEVSPWGKRFRSESLTRSYVSVLIDGLRSGRFGQVPA